MQRVRWICGRAEESIAAMSALAQKCHRLNQSEPLQADQQGVVYDGLDLTELNSMVDLHNAQPEIED